MKTTATPGNYNINRKISHYLPILCWLKHYSRTDFNGDMVAGIITAILLVPQGIAYAILAGLPPQMGLYASILPAATYAMLGTSKTLSVGPVSIAAIMIAGALHSPEVSVLGNPVESALILAAESGLLMLLMSLLGMGGLIHFISHPVLAGFTTGAALVIIASQFPPMLGLSSPVCKLDISCCDNYLAGYNPNTLSISLLALSLLILFRKPLPFLLKKARCPLPLVTGLTKCGPLFTIFFCTSVSNYYGLAEFGGMPVVGKVPAGLPALNFNLGYSDKWYLLLHDAFFIGLIAYIESVAIAKVTANLRGEKINPNQELIALGLANLATAISGGMAVAGGFSRTMVNFSAGARTQMAMLIAAGLLGVSVIFFSELFADIPKAALSAIIIMAVFRLVRLPHIFHTWNYDRGDGFAELATCVGVLILGIEQGISLGIVLTIASQLRKTSQPHIAVVGRVPQTEHYRNVKRHAVETWHHILMVRIDESLSFANISYIEDYLNEELNRQPSIRHVVLIFTSVNDIDATALETLENINMTLKLAGKTLNIAEAKGPILDKLNKTRFLQLLPPGKVFFRTEDATRELG